MARLIMQLTGRTGLVMHNVQLADKYHPITQQIKKLTDKKSNRTEEDDQKIEELEFKGSLYYEKGVGIYVPAIAIVRTIEQAAKITRQGAKVSRGVSLLTDKVPLDYDGPRDLDGLWKLPEFRFRLPVRVGNAKVMRMRPIFRQWSLTFEAEVLTDVLDVDAVTEFTRLGGLTGGLLEARKIGMGRFEAESG